MNCSKNNLKSISDHCFKIWAIETFDFDAQCLPETIHGTQLGTATIVSNSVGVLGNVLTMSSETIFKGSFISIKLKNGLHCPKLQRKNCPRLSWEECID